MPIYEYLCRPCNRIYSVFMPTMFDERAPRCPRCGAADIERQLSLFAFVRGGHDPLAAIPKPPDEAVAAEASATDEAAIAPPERDPKLYRWDEVIREGESEERVIIRRKHRRPTKE